MISTPAIEPKIPAGPINVKMCPDLPFSKMPFLHDYLAYPLKEPQHSLPAPNIFKSRPKSTYPQDAPILWTEDSSKATDKINLRILPGIVKYVAL